MGIIERDFDPETEQPPSRSEIVNAIKGLKPFKIIYINPHDGKTRQRVYTAASRERKPIRTAITSAGLKVWLRDQPPKLGKETVRDIEAEGLKLKGDTEEQGLTVEIGDEFAQG